VVIGDNRVPILPVITNERDDADLWYGIACGALLVFAAAIRFRNLGSTLFEDEVWVAELIRHGGWHAHSYSTPPLFYAMCRGWTAIRGISNTAIREPAAILGAALCAVPLFAPLTRTSRFVSAMLLAFSSPLLFYSGRAKQYTLEAFAVMLLIVLFLHVNRTGSRMVIIAFFAVGAVAVMTLYSPVFVLVPMALLCIRRPRLLAGFALLFALFGLAYLRWLAPGAESIRLHGDMNAYFAANGRWVTSPALLIAGTMHWVGQAMNLVRFWWLAATLLVMVWLVRERRLDIALIAVLPPVMVAAASTFRLYPYGEVRLMIFCLPALFLLLADSVASVARRLPLLLLLVVPFVIAGVAGDPYNRTYMHIDDLRPMFEMIARSSVPGEAIYADPSYGEPLRYECPALAANIRQGTQSTMTMPGWYIQRITTFRPGGAGVVMRIGDVMAARREP
jgi:hypothetical protein